MTPPRPLQSLIDAIAQMTAAVAKSIVALEDGALIDFADLQAELEGLCNRAIALPKSEQLIILPAMIELRELFDRLTEQLTHLAKSDAEVSARQAAAAYGKIAGQF